MLYEEEICANEERKGGDEDVDEAYVEEVSKMEARGGRYITDALLLKCATNAQTKDKKSLLRKEGRLVFFTLITHMNLERQKLVSIEMNDEVA